MHMKLKEFLKKNWNYIIVFLIPWVLIIVHSFLRDSWLTGNGSLLNGDTKTQLYPLFVELWNKVHSGESIFFSWNAGNGVDFYTNFGYYLISPFNLIVLALPKSCIENAIQFVMVLKWSLAGVSMTYYFMHTKHNKMVENKKLIAALFGLAFVLSNYMIMQFGYFNWTDVIILFPILLLLLEKMMETGKWKLYYIWLTLSMLCNFYMSYQVCIFLVIWCLLEIVQMNPDTIKNIGKFIGSSVLAACSSLVVILPCVFLVTNRYSTDIDKSEKIEFAKKMINGIVDMGQQLFLYQGDLLDWNSAQPKMFFSVGCFVLVGLYFFVSVSIKDKIKYSLVCLLFLISCCSGALTVFWHGFAIPNGIFQRYLYMFIFLMLFMALQVITNLSDVKYWKIFIVAILEGCLFVYSFFKITTYEDFYGYLATAFVFVFYQVLLVLFVKKSIRKKSFLIVFSLIVSFEVISNGYYELNEYNVSTWNDYAENKNVSELVKEVDLDDGERINILQSPMNAGLYENASSPNMFLSYCNGNMVSLYNKLGISYSKNAFCAAEGTSPFINLLLNTRYGISTSETGFSDVEELKTVNSMSLYRMTRLAGMGYMTNQEVQDWDIQNKINFDLQNDFIKKAVGGEDIFEVIYPDATFTDGYLSYKSKENYLQSGYYDYDYVSKAIPSMEMTQFSFKVEEDMDLYMVAFSQTNMMNSIYIDDTRIYYDETEKYEANYHIGKVKKGQKITIYSKHDLNVGQEAEIWFRFAKFNEENYAKAYKNLSKNVYQIDRMDSAYVSGTIHADEDGIMMTSIPAMDGFTVYVDGEETEFDKIGGAFIGVPVKAGDHKVEFKYMTPYFKQGLIASLTGILIFAMICVIDYRKNKKKENTEEMKTVIEG